MPFSERNGEREARWIKELLDREGVPVASYAAQGGGVCSFTLAGRVAHLLDLLRHAQIPVTRGLVEPVSPRADER